MREKVQRKKREVQEYEEKEIQELEKGADLNKQRKKGDKKRK